MADIRRIILQSPLLPPAVCVAGVIAAIMTHPVFALVPLAMASLVLMARMYNEALLCLILSACAVGLTWQQLHAYRESVSFLSHEPHYGLRVEGSVIRCFSKSVWIETKHPAGKFEIIPPEGTSPQLGERWRFSGMHQDVPPPLYRGCFDRPAWHRQNLVAGRIIAQEAESIGKGSAWSRILSHSDDWRQRIIGILQYGSTSDDRRVQVMASLLLGEKRGLDPETYHSFRTSGSLHIFAVSGLHIGIAAGLILMILHRTRIHPIQCKLLTIPLLAAYVYVTGMPVSAMRACVMICIFFMAMSLRQKNRPLNTLALTAIVFLLWSPVQLYDAGFQLSFLIFGVITVAGAWQHAATPIWRPDPFIPKRFYTTTEKLLCGREYYIRLLVILPLCCWLASIPVTAGNFGTINLYSPLTNILMTPIIPFVMLSCMLSIALCWCPPLLAISNMAARYLAELLLCISQYVAALPAALIPACPPADSGQFMVIPHRDGSATVMLGNPGLLINGGSAQNIRYTVAPILFSNGFTPKAHVLTKPQQRLMQGSLELGITWPRVLQLGPSSNLTQPCFLPCAGGSIQITAPPTSATPYGIMDDHCAPVIWQHKGKRLIYVGDSSHATVTSLAERQADVLIIGRHARDPFDDVELILESKAKTVIFTNPPSEELARSLEPHIRLYRTTIDGVVNLNLDQLPD